MIVPRTQPESAVVVVVLVVVVADGERSGHGIVYGHDFLRLSRD
jgi:hypothetical protein